MRSIPSRPWLTIFALFAGFALVGCGDDAPSSPVGLDDDELPADTVPPNTPTGLTVTSSPTNLVIEWAPNSEPDLAGYILELSTDRGTTWNEFEFLITDTFHEDVYRGRADYRIRAADLVGNESAHGPTATFLVATGGGPKIPAMPR